jgi:hypothetical protein
LIEPLGSCFLAPLCFLTQQYAWFYKQVDNTLAHLQNVSTP